MNFQINRKLEVKLNIQKSFSSTQDKLLPEQDLDELNDSNSFLSQAINSAVKDLEHSVVDPDWFLQNDPAPPYPTITSIQGSNSGVGVASIQQPTQHNSQVFQKPLPPPPITPSPMASTSQPIPSSSVPASNNSPVLIPSPFPSPSSILSSGNTTTASKHIDKIEGIFCLK